MKIKCEWCGQRNKVKRENCRFCGAPLPDASTEFERGVEALYKQPYVQHLVSGSAYRLPVLESHMVSGSSYQASQLINLDVWR